LNDVFVDNSKYLNSFPVFFVPGTQILRPRNSILCTILRITSFCSVNDVTSELKLQKQAKKSNYPIMCGLLRFFEPIFQPCLDSAGLSSTRRCVLYKFTYLLQIVAASVKSQPSIPFTWYFMQLLCILCCFLFLHYFVFLSCHYQMLHVAHIH